MTSASREPLWTGTAACSLATAALAASSARRLSAAWAPIASDTVPANAARMPIDRRETRGCHKVITVYPWVAAFHERAARHAGLFHFLGLADPTVGELR